MPQSGRQESTPRDLSELTAISPLDGRYWDEIRDLSPYTSEMALIQARVEVEARYLIALSGVGLVRPLASDEHDVLINLGPNMRYEQVVRVKEIEATTQHDVKAMERVFREMVAGTSLADVTEMIHFGLTSEDVNNLSYRLMLDRATKNICIPALDRVVDGFAEHAEKYKNLPMLARTHGQPAVPTTLGKEMVNIAVRLNRQVRKLSRIQLTGKITGAVGDFNAHRIAASDINWINFSKDFVMSFGFEPNIFTTQINSPDDLIELFQAYQRLNGVLLDAVQDIWRYISDDWFTQEVKPGEVGSSVMPQKINPIRLENAEGNICMANSILEGMGRKLAVSRLQRDLSDSTVMRNVGVAFAHGVLACRSTVEGLKKIHPNVEAISSALNSNWTILSEGVQTVLRRAGVLDPYSLVADLVKGQRIGPDEWRTWAAKLPVSPEIIEQVIDLTPGTYTGYAADLTEAALKEIAASR